MLTPLGEASLSSPDLGSALDREARESVQILIVDDEHTLRESCASLLRSEGFPTSVCGRGDEAATLLQRKHFDILLVDLYMPQVDGLDILRQVRSASPDSLVILMTGNPSVQSSVTALRDGAWDYLPKPFSATHLQILIGRAAHAVTIARESRDLTENGARRGSGQKVPLLGSSSAIRQVIEQARKVAGTDASIFLTGESGTGKELLARFIHANSRRSSRELVSVNCAAIPEALVESEMFGHLAGSFTGALKDKQGLLDVAHGGTLFLDELTEMPYSVQAKLLRVIQDGAVRRVGSTRTDMVVNVRFISATNQDPRAAVSDHKLRQDLHFRLRVVPIHLPPLRDRPEDIPLLAADFLREFWNRHRGPEHPCPRISQEALHELRKRRWSGNVRELRNVVEHTVVLMDGGRDIEAEDLPLGEESLSDGGEGPLYGRHVFNQSYHAARDTVLGEFEKDYLQHVVREASGNISHAARLADVDRTTLYRLMEKHGTRKGRLLTGPS